MDKCNSLEPTDPVSSSFQSTPQGTLRRKTIWRGKLVIVQEVDQPLPPEQQTLQKLRERLKNKPF